MAVQSPLARLFRRPLRALGRAILAAALAFGPAPLLADAEADRGFLTGFLESSLSDAGREVRITGFAGALSARATIEELTIADADGVWLIVRNAVLDWNRPALLSRRLEVNELTAAEILLLRPPRSDPDGIDLPTPEARAFTLPELPLSIRIGRIAAERVELAEAVLGETVVLELQGGGNLAGGTGRSELTVQRIDGAAGRMSLEISFDNASRQLETDLVLSEAPGGVAARLLSLPGMPSVDLTIQGEGPLEDFGARIGLATDGVERFGGTVTLRGENESGLAFSTELGGDLRPLLPEDLHAFFGADTRLVAEGIRPESEGFDLRTFRLSTDAANLTGELRFGPDGLPELARLRGHIRGTDGAPVPLPSQAGGLTIAGAELTLDFDASQSEDWTFSLTAEGLAGDDLAVAAIAIEGGGRIQRQSDVDDGTGAMGPTGRSISLQLGFAADGIAPTDPGLADAVGEALSGQMALFWEDGEPVIVERFNIAGRGLRLDGEGQIDLAGITGRVSLAIPDIARFSALSGRSLGGRLDGSVEGSFAPLSGIFDLRGSLAGQDLRLGQPEVDGLLAGASGIAIDVLRDETGIHLRALGIDARSLVLDASGMISTTATNVTGRLDFSDLSVLGPSYRGAVSAEGRLVGSEAGLRIIGSGTGSGVAAGRPEFDGLLAGDSRFDADMTLGPEGILSIAELAFHAAPLSLSVSGRLDTTPDDRQIAELPTDLALQAEFRDLAALGPGFGGRLSVNAQVAGIDGGERLTLSATGSSIGVGIAPVDILLRGTTLLDLTATRRGQRFRVETLELSNPQLSAGGSATVEGETRRLQLTGQIADLGLLATGFDGPGNISGQITEAPGGYQIDFTGDGPGGLNLTLAGRLTPSLIANITMRGDGDLALASSFLDDILVQGPVRADLRLVGALRIENLTGQISTRGARAVSPRQYLTFQDIDGTAELGGGRLSLSVTGNAARGGSFRLSGPISLRPGFTADLTGRLTDLQVVDPALYSTSVSGDLVIRGPIAGGGALISGALTLGNTEVRIPSAGFVGATYVPEGIRHIGETENVRTTRIWARIADDTGEGSRSTRPFPLDLAVTAPNRVFIRGRGLDAEVGGSLVLRGTTANVLPSGEFGLIRGRIDVLGNRFSLTDGFASLQGRFIPFVRLAASTEADGITARIVIEGLATEPQISFTSSPELPEEEVVSRLLFGRNLGSLSPFQAAQLASAVATLSGRGGIGIMERLRENFGLDDLDFTTDETGTAAVRAGAYVAENVYTDLRLDADGRSEVTINLDISPSVALRGRAGSDGRSGIGIFFERDY